MKMALVAGVALSIIYLIYRKLTAPIIRVVNLGEIARKWAMENREDDAASFIMGV